jgi:hypothetical protein
VPHISPAFGEKWDQRMLAPECRLRLEKFRSESS